MRIDEETSDIDFDQYWDDVNQAIYTDPIVVGKLSKKYSKYLRLISEVAVNTRLLDVGSGSGIFVHMARTHEFEAMGLDPSSRAVHISSARFSIPVVRGLLLPHDDLPRNFGIVTAWDVIEHVPDPAAFVRAVQVHLVDNGLLVIETPDESSLIRSLIRFTAYATCGKMDLRSYMYYRAHRYYFT